MISLFFPAANMTDTELIETVIVPERIVIPVGTTEAVDLRPHQRLRQRLAVVRQQLASVTNPAHRL